MTKGTLFVISAPSGAGKSTLVERIRRIFPDILYSISCTTRAPRGGETDGIDYYFVNREKFLAMAAAGELLEWKEVHGNLYGTPARPVNDALETGGRMILDIDVQGADEVFKRVPSSVGIFITVPDMATLEERLRGRGTETEASIRTRICNAGPEIERGSTFAYQIVNDDLETAAAELASVIEKASGSCKAGTTQATSRL
jgi:guanylate kinase